MAFAEGRLRGASAESRRERTESRWRPFAAESLGAGCRLLHVRGVVRRAVHSLLPPHQGTGKRAALPRGRSGRLVLLGRRRCGVRRQRPGGPGTAAEGGGTRL